MEVVAESVAGIDVHQKQITVTILIGSENVKKPKKVSKRFGTTTNMLRDCGQWLKEHGVEQVLMESTGQYWRPIWQVLESFDFQLILCNPRIIKNIPGKKTDQKDSEWLSELARYGLVSASYVPPRKIQELRESTRSRKKMKESLTRIKNEIHNILQRSNIKLTSFISDLFKGSGLKLLNMIINGEVLTLDSITKCMHGKLKASPEQLLESMNGVLSQNDRNLLVIQMNLLNSYLKCITDLNDLIDEQIREYSDLCHRLEDIPGISSATAQVIIAEVGVDVSPFPDVHHLASWAGLCPGNYESAGVKHGSRILHGNVYLKKALVTAAMGAKVTKETGLKDYFWRLKSRMCTQKALIAVAHKILRIVYSLIKSEKTYREYKKDQRKAITSVQI
ncbi:transposase, IS111A IS1328 IS1533 transposase IS116 IS110 IS902 [Companilactobacillus mindensis DSM 14500]|uniref:Transposase, IS111A IS1328 IS1533 transposase IS116 IS110 IS902 n=1 Tax=Companilactobacillus mindensis DSM 14500 TaxID=1423770 RepID=A0A0R1QSV6_9LACO|nr:IS110 family transposase [Companilactobacillus mindensis]KRL44331.1 transposase, IS111A IS1328 IS1533 transposase IS116 IS110 IS902 [Companilactobacillus mindensis DSM 14500]GEO79856.1 IS110 family transposase [Companilactobacillus mindensis]